MTMPSWRGATDKAWICDPPFGSTSLLTPVFRKRALRMPSRDKNRMLEHTRSNWMAAVPNTEGEAKRKRDWLRVKVRIRESSWRSTSDLAVNKGFDAGGVEAGGIIEMNCLRYMSIAGYFKKSVVTWTLTWRDKS